MVLWGRAPRAIPKAPCSTGPVVSLHMESHKIATLRPDWEGHLSQLQLAYIDPGAGSIVLQLLLAGLAGVAVLARSLARRFRSRLTQRRKDTREPDAKG